MKQLILTITASSFLFFNAHALTVSEDFEGEATDGSAPSGWILVDTGDGEYSTVAGTGNPGQSGNITFSSRGSSNAPSTYLVNAGTAFDATQAFSGSFDFYLIEEGNYSNVNFIVGDVQDGLTSTSAGEYINVLLDEKQFGSRADIYDGAGGTLFDGTNNNNYEIFTGTWNSATFSWTPTSGTTGDFSISWNGTEGPMTATAYTFDSQNIFFGFGGGDTSGRFDNISITAQPVPEPSTFILIGLASVGLMIRRRR